MAFEQDYFDKRKYMLKQQLVERHVLEVLRWASKEIHQDLLKGQGKRALDVGCAFGYTSRVLAQLGYETFGADISNLGVKQAKANTNAQCLVCDAQTTLPFLPYSFDLITCFDVLEHLEDPKVAFSNMYAASKGILVCTTPNKKVERPIRKFTRDYDETHISVKSEEEWLQIITETHVGPAVKLAAFLDCPLRFNGKLFYRSFHIPRYGLTVRIVVWK